MLKKLLFVFLILVNFQCLATTIDFVFDNSPGAPVDIYYRRLIEHIEAKSSFKFNIVYKPGASSNIAYTYINSTKKPVVFVAQPKFLTNKTFASDGYPIGIADSVNPIFYLGESVLILEVNANSDLYKLQDLIDLSKRRPIRFGFGGGTGTNSYSAMKKMCDTLLADCISINFKSGSEGMSAVLNDTTDIYPMTATGGESIVNNPYYRSILLLSTRSANHFNISKPIPSMPNNLSYLNDNNRWFMFLSKNLLQSDQVELTKVLKSEETYLSSQFGMHYVYKDPAVVWSQILLQNK